MPLDDYTLSKSERHAWWCALTCKPAPLVFPATGSGAPRQRPQPAATLQFWLRVVLQLTSFQTAWGLLFFILSISIRRSIIGAVLNLPYAGAALLASFGALKLSYAYVATALLASLAVDGMFIAFSMWAFYDTGEAVVLALHLPAVPVDAFVTFCCVPLALHLYRAEHQASYPVAPTAEPPVEAGCGAAAGAATAPSRQAEPRLPPAVAHQDSDDPLAATPEFRCPITLLVMRDPVIAADGHSYEREALETWLRSHRTSPLTGARLQHMHVTPNHRLRSLIESAREGTAIA